MKTDGLASAAAALHYWERRQEMLSNNLANADTAGFKGERVFARLLDGVTVADTATDHRAGQVSRTGNALDLAIEGEGYLVVSTPRGERFSRGGALTLDAEGFIADQSGNRLLGTKGPIAVGGGTVAIDAAGVVSVNGEAVDRLRVETNAPGESLQHDAGTLFVPPSKRLSLDAGTTRITQGAIEQSNVSTISSMVDMIAVQRAYAASEKAIVVLDGIHGTIANELAKS
jgi:flagellar basal-body rod protein FlgF